MRAEPGAYVDDLPALEPIVAHELTDDGWRGLTGQGEVLEVSARNGGPKPMPPPELVEMHNGKRIGRRALPLETRPGMIKEYLEHYNRSLALYKNNELDGALLEIDQALEIADTTRGRFNRSMILLAMGLWPEGFEQYETRLELRMPPMCAELERAGVRRWRGEDVRGKWLLLAHDAGFGDTIMMLRFVPQLRALGADVSLVVPPELERLAEQVAPIARDVRDADFFCPALSLLHLLQATPVSVFAPPYLKVDPALFAKWRKQLVPGRRRIGIAWSVSQFVHGDFPRAIPLEQLVNALEPEVELYSMQTHSPQEGWCGIHMYKLEDFADCAALMSCMDEIVSVDTAAINLAGAIGHPRASVLLSHWASWRWHQNAFYPAIKVCRQRSAGDWGSALAQL